MSGRGMSAAMLAEIVKAQTQPIHLMEVRFDAADGGTSYMTDAYRNIVWGGNTYLATGQLLGFDGLEESAEVRTTEVQVALSGVDQSWMANLLLRQYINRTLVIYKGMLAVANDVLVIDPIPVVQGPMDAPVMEEDPGSGKCTIAIAVTSLGADFDSPAGRHTNLAEQQVYFPSDTAFRFCAQVAGLVAGREVYWGLPDPGAA